MLWPEIKTQEELSLTNILTEIVIQTRVLQPECLVQLAELSAGNFPLKKAVSAPIYSWESPCVCG